MGGRSGASRLRMRSFVLLVSAASALVTVPPTAAVFTGSPSVGSNMFTTATLSPASGLSVTQTCGYSSISYISSRTSTSTNGVVTVTKPSSLAVNDIMVAQVFIRKQPATFAPPSGWTLLRTDSVSGQLTTQAAYYHVAGSSEPASYTWTADGSASTAAGIAVYRGADASSPIDARGGQGNPSSTSITAPSITTVTKNTLLLGLFGIRVTGTITAPAGMTKRFDVSTYASPASNNAHIAIVDASFVGPGATGTRVATSSAAQTNVGQLIALRPVVTVGASLSWTATPSTFAEGYKVQRWVGASQQAEYPVTPRTTVNYNDSPISNATAYTYKVLAYYQNWTSSAATRDLTPTC